MVVPVTVSDLSDFWWVRVLHPLRSAWRKWRGLSGSFSEPEDSERARALNARWDARWPGSAPIGWQLDRDERWVRFHSLPGSKRYADSPDEYAEILRRHNAVLADLQGTLAPARLIVMAEDWDHHSFLAGWSRQALPAAWPWRIVRDESDPEAPPAYCWVASGLSAEALDELLLAVADEKAEVMLADPDLEWIYRPYDGGADVYLPTVGARDELRERHAGWLSDHAPGL
jgi:hypothetical protein